MLAKKDPAFLVPPESNYFHPEDLASMRQAFKTACRERPLAASTKAQRLTLAKAIVVSKVRRWALVLAAKGRSRHAVLKACRIEARSSGWK